MAMLCCECGATPEQRALYRVNAKGEPGVWMCEVCMPATPDPAVRRVVDALKPPPTRGPADG